MLASAQGTTAPAIAAQLHYSDQTVRNVIVAFNADGLAALQACSHVAHHLPHTAFTPEAQEQLKLLIRRSPHAFGKDTSVWSLHHLADVCFCGIATGNTEIVGELNINLFRSFYCGLHLPMRRTSSPTSAVELPAQSRAEAFTDMSWQHLGCLPATT